VTTAKKNDELQEEQPVEAGVGSSSDEAIQESVGELEQNAEVLLEEARAEAEDLRDKVLRVAAEFENYKKRMERERLTMLKYSGEPILREFLSVVDNLERAVSQGRAGGLEAEKNLAALLEGVQLTLKGLVDVLNKFEVKPIDCTGQPFDPNKHEALTMESSDTVPANHVINEFEKGYYYKDRLLRPARVIVSSGSSAQ